MTFVRVMQSEKKIHFNDDFLRVSRVGTYYNKFNKNAVVLQRVVEFPQIAIIMFRRISRRIQRTIFITVSVFVLQLLRRRLPFTLWKSRTRFRCRRGESDEKNGSNGRRNGERIGDSRERRKRIEDEKDGRKRKRRRKKFRRPDLHPCVVDLITCIGFFFLLFSAVAAIVVATVQNQNQTGHVTQYRWRAVFLFFFFKFDKVIFLWICFGLELSEPGGGVHKHFFAGK